MLTLPTVPPPIKRAKRLRAPAIAPEIVQEVCSLYSVTLAALEAVGRPMALTEPRGVLMLLLRDFAGMSFREIGAMVGGRDHCTAVRNIKNTRARIASDIMFSDRVNYLRRRIQRRRDGL